VLIFCVPDTASPSDMASLNWKPSVGKPNVLNPIQY
jgi:hypothetical protein